MSQSRSSITHRAKSMVSIIREDTGIHEDTNANMNTDTNRHLPSRNTDLPVEGIPSTPSDLEKISERESEGQNENSNSSSELSSSPYMQVRAAVRNTGFDLIVFLLHPLSLLSTNCDQYNS